MENSKSLSVQIVEALDRVIEKNPAISARAAAEAVKDAMSDVVIRWACERLESIALQRKRALQPSTQTSFSFAGFRSLRTEFSMGGSSVIEVGRATMTRFDRMEKAAIARHRKEGLPPIVLKFRAAKELIRTAPLQKGQKRSDLSFEQAIALHAAASADRARAASV